MREKGKSHSLVTILTDSDNAFVTRHSACLSSRFPKTFVSPVVTKNISKQIFVYLGIYAVDFII